MKSSVIITLNMEIELKYKLNNAELVESIWNDDYLKDFEEPDSRQRILMKASYFDTDDNILSNHDIAFRVRMEGERCVASLKWNDKDSTIGGLHMREEINVPLNDESKMLSPDPGIFKESDVGRELLEVLGDDALSCVMEINFVRSRMRIDTGDIICELALDDGEIFTSSGVLPICEMEIELFVGEKEDLIRFGEDLASHYGLEPELKSKYARGLSIIKP